MIWEGRNDRLFIDGEWVTPDSTHFVDLVSPLTEEKMASAISASKVDAVIAQEEIFGPVISILSFDTDDEAVAIANHPAYGLHGAVFSADTERAVNVARRIRTGAIDINGASAGYHAPLGGRKKYGIGREAGIEGFDGYVEIKSIGVPPSYAEQLSS
jgi:aldehyde dehydrogenase (NAD+)